MEIIQGVYKIMNITTGKTYIGRSTNIHRRFQDHRRKLIKGTHSCQGLQFDIDMTLMDNTYFDIDDILRFEIIENIPNKDFKFRELEEIYHIPPDQRYNMPDLKDDILYHLGCWCKEQHIDFEIDYTHPDCKNKQPLNWNLMINTGDMVILWILRMDTDDAEMTAKYIHMDEIRNNWIGIMPEGWRWILKTYDLTVVGQDIANELIAEINANMNT